MLLARGRDHDVFDRAIDVQVSRLRKLIEPDPANPRYIQTVWGFGYVFVPDEAPAPARPYRGMARDACGRARCSGGSRCCCSLVVAVALVTAITALPPRPRRAGRAPVQRHKGRCSCRRCARRSIRRRPHERRRDVEPHRQRIRRAHRSATASAAASARPPAAAAMLRARGAAARPSSGPETEVRLRARRHAASVRARQAGGRRLLDRRSAAAAPRSEDEPSRALELEPDRAGVVLLVAAFVFARYLARPLRELNAAVERRRPRRGAAAAAGERAIRDRDPQSRRSTR